MTKNTVHLFQQREYPHHKHCFSQLLNFGMFHWQSSQCRLTNTWQTLIWITIPGRDVTFSLAMSYGVCTCKSYPNSVCTRAIHYRYGQRKYQIFVQLSSYTAASGIVGVSINWHDLPLDIDQYYRIYRGNNVQVDARLSIQTSTRRVLYRGIIFHG
jgi:hypothetical protein